MVPLTVAVNCCCIPIPTFCVDGKTATVMGTVTVTVAEAIAVRSTVLVAVMVKLCVLARLAALNEGEDPLGSFGAVVGATVGDTGQRFDINGPLLAPGYGEQGGGPADIPRIFGTASKHVLASSSRGVLRLGPDRTAMTDAVRRANDQLAAALG